MFIRAIRDKDHWRVTNHWGHDLSMACASTFAGESIAMGVLGTRVDTKIAGSKTALFADMLSSLQRPIYLIDTRRNGTGAQSSWSPREFATVIPQRLSTVHPYEFLHLPCVAPSVELLGTWKKEEAKDWLSFRNRYVEEVSGAPTAVAQAFVETAATAGGIAIFLCAEADRHDFRSLPHAEQNEHYCHRFTLTRQVADVLKQSHAAVEIERIRFDLADFAEAKRNRTDYRPRTERL